MTHPPCDVCGKPTGETHDEATCDDLGDGRAVIDPTRTVHVYVPVCVELTLDQADNVVSTGAMHIDLDGFPTNFMHQWECDRGEYWTTADTDVLEAADDAVAEKLHAQPYLVKTWNYEHGDMDTAEVYPDLAHALAAVKAEWAPGMAIDSENGVNFDAHGALTHLIVTKKRDTDYTLMTVERVDLCDTGNVEPILPDPLGRAVQSGIAGVIALIEE